jgi:uncharacterized protein
MRHGVTREHWSFYEATTQFASRAAGRRYRLRLPLGIVRRGVSDLHYAYWICIMDIEFDPDKAAENLRKHRVSFAHAEQALRDPAGVTVEDPDAEGEPRFVTLGMDALGRTLVVVYTPRGRRTRIISARKASKAESLAYAKGI